MDWMKRRTQVFYEVLEDVRRAVAEAIQDGVAEVEAKGHRLEIRRYRRNWLRYRVDSGRLAPAEYEMADAWAAHALAEAIVKDELYGRK